MASNSKRRPRIAIGQVVRSTNPILDSCARAIVIMEYYCPISNKRIKRIVKRQNE